MKSLFTHIITIVYLLLSTGVSVNAQYCMGNFVGVKTPWQNEDCKAHSEAEEQAVFSCCLKGDDSEKCCDQTFIQIKLNVPALNSTALSLNANLFAAIVPKQYFDFTFIPKAILDYSGAFYRPPPILKDIRILIHSLLFYH